MKPTLGVFGWGQFMQFFTPYLSDYFEIQVYDKVGNNSNITELGALSVSLEQAAGCDFVLLGYPAGYIQSLVQKVSPYIQPGAVVFDICSVKTPAIEAMLKYLPDNCHIIGTHPIFGPQSGKNGIEGLKMTFSDIRSDRKVFEDFKSIFGNKMKLQVSEMSAQEHDTHMAYVQGITHMIGRALKQIDIPNSPIATQSYFQLREVSELVGYDSDELFLSIQKDNPYAEEARDTFMMQLKSLEKMIEEKNTN